MSDTFSKVEVMTGVARRRGFPPIWSWPWLPRRCRRARRLATLPAVTGWARAWCSAGDGWWGRKPCAPPI